MNTRFFYNNIYLLFVLIFGAILTFGACSSKTDRSSQSVSPEVRIMKVCFNQELQVMDGFGASDAWRCQMVGKYWPEEKKEEIADMLFSQEFDEKGNPKGIGLSIWRFYIGAGSLEQGAGSDISDEWRRAECFQLPDRTYDWQKQEGQRWFLQAARARGVDKYLAFTISPPVHMTLNGKAFSSQKQKMNIKEGMMPDYADFLVDCVENLQKNEGISFDYLSPVNEPQWDWLAGNNGKASQEGTPAVNEELYQLTRLISERLQKRGLSTKIALGEAASINYLYEIVDDDSRDNQIDVFWDRGSSLCVAPLQNMEHVITGHSYFSVWPVAGQVEHRQKLNTKVKQYPGLKYWQTEYCILENPGEDEIPGGAGGQRDLGIKTALFVARIIHNDIVLSDASSWQWWTALTRADYKDGLIYLDDGSNNGSMDPDYCKKDGYVRSSKLMWAFGNYSFFVRPGMKRIHVEDQDPLVASTDVMISAYKDPDSGKLVIVAVNTSNKEYIYKLNIDEQVKGGKLIPYVTSDQYNLEKGVAMKTDSIIIFPQSVVTLTGEVRK
ncbi:MAG: glycosyl hydrolase [Tannerella sp.]|jgi:O-glycosyl hydrolase|nr:glycosyl hydrolase [Tannerella sp.]